MRVNGLMEKETIRKIGGEIEIELAHLRNNAASQKFLSYGKPFELWVDTGRGALTVILDTIKAQPRCSLNAWLPSFLCPIIVETFQARGFNVQFYKVDYDLKSRPEVTPTPGDTFFFIHYFGFPQRDFLDQVGSLKNQGVWIIEDLVQGSLTTQLGHTGHFSFNSMRKVLPQPEGALVSSDLPLVESSLLDPDPVFFAKKFTGKVLRKSGADDSVYMPFLNESEAFLDSKIAARRCSPSSLFLMGQTDISQVKQRRRENFEILREALKGISQLKPLFLELPEDIAPLGFPVLVANGKRNGLKEYLKEFKIYCPIHWLMNTPLNDVTRESHFLSENILTLITDQRFDSSDMSRMVDAIRSFFARNP